MKPLKILIIILAGLWFSACTHMESPQAPKTTEQETTEKKTEKQKSTSEAAESQAQEAQKKSETRQTKSQETTETKPTQAEQNKNQSQAPSPDTSESKLQQDQEKPANASSASQEANKEISEKTDARQAASPPTAPTTADEKLERAREDLRISQETEKRIASELKALKNSGTATEDEIRNYEAYHKSVQAMVEENRKIVAKMEAAYAKNSQANVTSDTADAGEMQELLDPKIPEEQTEDKVAALDRQLNASLNEFDEKLLNEMDAIRAESADRMRDLAQEAADAAKRARESGAAEDTSEAQAENGDQDQSAESKAGEETDSDKSTEDTQTASGQQSGQGEKGSTREDKRRASYEDDDIVARQLREAAENETDPELKEKLWKEYEDYKKSK